MFPLPHRVTLIVLLFVAAGCSAVKDEGNPDVGWFGSDSTLHTIAEQKMAGDKVRPTVRYAATLQVSRYADQRNQSNPRLLGISTQLIRGVSGSQLLLDQDVADLVTSAFKLQFEKEGYQLLEESGVGKAMFEVSGTIKDLNLNVKYRDEINIAIETTVKDLRNGEVVWSGLVTEKHDRFAGVSGNNKDDVVAYLDEELRVASNKTVAAVSASLMAAHPDLFNLTAGIQAIPGVSVYAVPVAAEPASGSSATIMPTVGTQPGSVAPLPERKSPASAGLLVVNTNPTRARVYVDGVYYGLSPLRVEMEPGVHAVEVRLNKYKTATEKVSVRKGDNTEMELSLER
ncbi:MAG: PEGA domain-containing protein [Gallionella sp.]